MKRRDLIKNITLTSVGIATAQVLPAQTDATQSGKPKKQKSNYGRTPDEIKRDEKLASETFFTSAEMAVITLLCDIILPAEGTSPSAVQAGVPAFIEFVAKDMPYQQVPLRGGIMWLDNYARKSFGKSFAAITPANRMTIVDAIAYPELASPAVSAGVSFFNLMRDLTLTGFYTTEAGFEDLGYVGNRPNNWQGPPPEVLKKFNF
ncbi:MAG: gluconate 2-dehydrogenase subunit 3 family protein [Bacteroidota bacterium]